MKTFSFKLDDKIFLEVEEITRALKVSRNRYINDAVSIYNGVHKRRLLKMQLEKESALTSQDSMGILHMFERQIDEIDSDF
jgi:predicted transcriptional regulator